VHGNDTRTIWGSIDPRDNRLDDVIEESRRSGEPISVTRRGKRVAVILESEVFDRLVDAADDAEDRRDLEAARADDDYVPWDEVEAALGLAWVAPPLRSRGERSSRS
jgi:prevent-host-death family protein